MNYTQLFKRISLLISDPEKAWKEIYKENDYRNVQGNFVFPLIALCGISTFIGCLIGNTEGPSVFQSALMKVGGLFISLFAGFFLVSYIVQKLNQRYLHREENAVQAQCYVGYSMVILFVLLFVSGFLSISIFFWILMFYTVYVTYQGAKVLVRVEDSKINLYAIVTALAIMLCPKIILFIFNELSVILN